MPNSKIFLIWSTLLTASVVLLSILLIRAESKIEDTREAVGGLAAVGHETSERVGQLNDELDGVIEGLTSIEQFLEPEYHRYIRDEIRELWAEVNKLK